MCVATSIAIATVAAPAAASIYGAHKVSSGNKEAAKLQSQAADRAAELQSKGSEDALAFQRQQAQNDWQNQELTRRGNYDLDAAHQRRLGALGDMLGAGPREIPAYVASQDPRFTSGGSVAQPGPATASPAGVPTDLNAALQQANQIAYGGNAKHTDPAYWQALWGKDPEYAWKRMLGWQAGGNDVATTGPYAGQGSAAPAGPMKPTPSPYGTITTMLQPRQPLTAALQMPGQG